jgi:hypothetical protein
MSPENLEKTLGWMAISEETTPVIRWADGKMRATAMRLGRLPKGDLEERGLRHATSTVVSVARKPRFDE